MSVAIKAGCIVYQFTIVGVVIPFWGERFLKGLIYFRRKAVTEFSEDLGGGMVNVGRVFSNAVGEAASLYHFDLLTMALHEIGHALGISMANTNFIIESTDGDIDITAPHPFAGTTIPLAFNNFGVTSNFRTGHEEAVMGGGRGVGGRSVLSTIDILANAQLSGFNNLNLNPAVVPEISLSPMPTGLAILNRLPFTLWRKR